MYDADRPVRTFYTQFQPTQAQFCGDLVICTEYNHASLWDLRVSSAGGKWEHAASITAEEKLGGGGG